MIEGGIIGSDKDVRAYSTGEVPTNNLVTRIKSMSW